MQHLAQRLTTTLVNKLSMRIKYFKQQKNPNRGAAGLLAINKVCPEVEMIKARN